MKATVEAHPNIALVKYWGKRDAALNLPHNGSISVTLAPMRTRTTVELLPGLEPDDVTLNGAPADATLSRRVGRFLDLFRARAGERFRARVTSENDFPTAAGLASSSSGYAALAMAASEALGLRLSKQELSILARQGSGSACRSIHGGFVEWRRGEAADGLDSFAIPLAPAHHWPIRVFIAVIDAGPKPIPSREAMQRTVATSPFYVPWVERAPADLDAVRGAIHHREIERLGPVIERNCLGMFATMLGADPPIRYWLPASVAVMQAVEAHRSAGEAVYFTLDAGPNVKVVCREEEAGRVGRWLAEVPGVSSVVPCGVGGAAERIA
jgi:diphosphomevalonate decarboxylase